MRMTKIQPSSKHSNQPTPLFPTDRDLAVAESYKSGMKLKDIASKHGLPHLASIYASVRRAKFHYPDRYKDVNGRQKVPAAVLRKAHNSARYKPTAQLETEATKKARARAAKMYEKYCSGMTLQEIGDEETPQITRERVRQLMRRFGFPSLGFRKERLRKPTPLSENEKAALQDYLNCVPRAKISEKHGVPEAKISYLRKREGLPVRRFASSETKERNESIIHDYYHSDLTVVEIAAKHGTDSVYPSQLIAKLGLPQTRKKNRRYSASRKS